MKMFLLASVVFCMQAAVQAQPRLTSIPKLSAKQVRQLIDTCTAPTIINFWASWCGPCIREIPYFEEQIKGTPVRLLLVSLDYPGAYSKTLLSFVRRKGFTSEVLYLNETDPQVFLPVIEKKWSGAIPASIFVNNSKKYYRFYDSQLTSQRLALELKALLAQ